MNLGDAIANELALPIDRISLEMIYRGLYHFSVARQKGLTDNPIQYFAEVRKSRFRNSEIDTKTSCSINYCSVS